MSQPIEAETWVECEWEDLTWKDWRCTDCGETRIHKVVSVLSTTKARIDLKILWCWACGKKSGASREVTLW